jgi:asparaginyl-tRNA synthetase
MSKNQKQILINEVLSGKVQVGSDVIVGGWVRTRRDSKAGVSFIALSDGSCFKTLQVVVANTIDNYNNEILKLTAGCSIVVKGKLIPSPAAGQPVELQANSINVVGWVEDPDTYPISPKYHTLEYLREHAHLRPRTNVIGAITRVRHSLSMAIHRFFHEQGFYWIHTPIITTSDCEGAGELLRVTALNLNKIPHTPEGKIDFSRDYFGRETFLTVSGQLNVESYCEALTKVYTFGPTFRAENSNTSRHLSEFWMVEPEIAFADLKDDALLAANMIKYLAKTVITECQDDMAFFADRIDKDCISRLEKIISSEFTYMEYGEAVEHLLKAKKKFEFPVKWGLDLQSEHERYLTEELIKAPVILMNYPKEIKSFYMRMNEDGKTVAAMDVLVPGVGEIMGGSQREERYDVLLKRMTELNLDTNIYKWYLDLRRYGTVKHAGFGLGLERMVMYVTGIQNIRDTIPFPRAPRLADY